MGKVVDGVELLRMIKEDKLKYGDKIKNTRTNAIYVYYDGTALWRIEQNKEFEEIGISVLVTGEFEILSKENEEIDIDKIEELGKILYIGNNAENVKVVFNNIIDKQNEILKALKQLNNKLKE